MPARHDVIVGIDDATDPVDALRAAEWIAASFGGRLVVVAVDPRSGSRRRGRTPAARRLEVALARAFAGSPLVPVETRQRRGSRAAVLLAESAQAAMLVVGARPGRALGRVTAACVVRARCPVLVVHGGRPRTRRRVVVGSAAGSADTALRLGAMIAAWAGAELVAVRAFDRPAGPSWTAGLVPSVPEVVAALPDRTAAVADLAARLLMLEHDVPDRLRAAVRDGPVPGVLLGAADHADLLVVGSTARSTWVAGALGSVTLQVAARAACPVLVVPPPDTVDRVDDAPWSALGTNGSAAGPLGTRA